MRAAWAAAGMLALAGLAGAAPSVAPFPSREALRTLAQGSLPLQLAPGPDGGTTVSATRTGSASTVTGSGTPRSYNTTLVNDTSAAALRVRLTLASATSINNCAQCSLELHQGSVVSAQITVAGRAVTQGQGPWMTINATGQPGSSWSIDAVAQKITNAHQTAVLSYVLEAQDHSGSGPVMGLWNMTMRYQS